LPLGAVGQIPDAEGNLVAGIPKFFGVGD